VLKMSRFFAVLGAVLVLAAVGGFLALKASPSGTSTWGDGADWGDGAEVTGYAASTIDGQTSGAVSVKLNGVSAARIDQLVERLPPASVTSVCAENAQVYRITFTPGTGSRQGLKVIGYRCGDLVVEVPSRGLSSDRVDRNCALLSAVRRLLPARATELQSSGCPGHDRLLARTSSRKQHGDRDGSGPKTPRHQRPDRPNRRGTGKKGTGGAPGASKGHDEKQPGHRLV
jgi:hypothetical protein